MRMLLRQRRSGLYFQRPGCWTVEIAEARDFKSVSRAVEAVERGGYPDMELVFAFEEPRRLGTVPVETLMASGTYPRRGGVLQEGGEHEQSELAKDGSVGK